MALRAVDDHPKLHDLKSILRCGRGEAIGYLEALWHFTGRFTPAGNIGSYSDAAIEGWIEWRGASGVLIQALIDSRWIEVSEAHRLVVHDWHDHADDATKLALRRKRLSFVTCIDMSRQNPDMSRQNPDTIPTQSGLPEPVPEPVPEPEPVLPGLAPTEAPARVVAFIPLANGEEYPVDEKRFSEWEKAFPGVDVANQVQRMRVWLDGNPTKRVTQRGVLRFAVNWLSREQDNGPQRRGTHGAAAPISRNQQRTNSNIEAARSAAAAIGAEVIDWPGRSQTGHGEPRDLAAVLIET